MASSAGSLNSLLKSLTRVGRAESVYNVASADRINAIQDAIRLLVRGENIVAGTNVLKRSADGYCVLTGNAGGGRGGISDVEFPFQLIGLVEPTSEFDPTIITRVRVVSGKINGEFPSGMGFDANPATQFKLDITDDTTICAEITFDPKTLVITSRTVFESDDPNDSVITADTTPSGPTGPTVPGMGTLIFEIGYAQIEYDEFSQPNLVTTQNNFVGNMQFELIYGAFNGQPAILPVMVYPLSTPSGTTSFVQVP